MKNTEGVQASLNQLLHAGHAVYGYDEDDKRILRQAAAADPDGLRLALESDPLIQMEIAK